jgi:ASC-1-like (ASCH) protein
MSLTSDNFEKIKDGTKTIECRLLDQKRELLKTGDQIEFKDAASEARNISTKIVAIHKFPSFLELLNHFPITSFGASNRDDLLMALKGFYTEQDEKEYGVVGIEIEIV